MATVTSVTKHFPSAKEGFVTTLASTISAGAATVPLNSVTGYTNGQVAVFVVEPSSTTNKQVFTGTIDTAGVQVTGVVWTEGSNTTHNAGSTVVDYVAATHMSMTTKGILVEHNQNGTHGAVTATSIVVTGSVTASSFVTSGSGTDNGWTVGLTAPSTVTCNGNRSYDIVITGTDVTSLISPGSRLRLTRTVSASTQCASLNGTTNYFNKTSPAGTTFTDDFVVSAWVKASSYANGAIVSRFNGTSGWGFTVLSTGQLSLEAYNAGGANFSNVKSYQSIPLNKWVHVTAQLDMSAFTATTTTSYIMIDGVDVPASVTRGGTNPTALIQAGDLQIGAINGAQFFPGKLSNVWYSSAKITQANVRTLISQDITSALCTTHSIVSAFTLNNTLNDVNTTSANNLTAQGSATATNSDSPFGLNSFGTPSATLVYGIVTKATFSTDTTVTVQVPEGNTIPTSGGITAAAYSQVKAPYGMPIDRSYYGVTLLLKTSNSASAAADATYNPNGLYLNCPIGAWVLSGSINTYTNRGAGGVQQGTFFLGTTAASSTGEINLTRAGHYFLSGGAVDSSYRSNFTAPYSTSSATPLYVNYITAGSTAGAGAIRGDLTGASYIIAELAYA